MGSGDVRLDRRTQGVAARMGRNPSASIPEAMGGVADREGTYRLLGNPRVRQEVILEATRHKTIERAYEAGRVRVVHDTTEVRFSGEQRREGLGWLDGDGQGYFLHGALVTGLDGVPLGMVAYQTLFREGEPRGNKKRGSRKADYLREDKESLRWLDVFEMADASLAGIEAVHVFDSGADDFHLIWKVQEALSRSVHGEKSYATFRAHHDREVLVRGVKGQERLFKVWGTVPATFSRQANVSARRDKKDNRRRSAKDRKRHPPRTARTAHLEVRAAPVQVLRPTGVPTTFPKALQLNAVSVREPHPPKGQAPIEWMLLTTAPIDTAEDVAAVIEHYCGRWVVEEFWKALKTGCALEKRQLETRRSHLNALAIFIPIAWNLLKLRDLARDQAGAQASEVLTDTQLRLLRAALLKRHGTHLPDAPTNRDVLLGIATLGGHIKNNGDPGWMVLGRGYEQVLTMELGWELALTTGVAKM